VSDESAARRRGSLPILLSLGLAAAAQCAAQGSLPWGADPLGVEPRVLREGTRLPGDGDAPNCAAGAVPDQPLALSRAADIALCNSPRIRVTWEAIKAQAGQLGEAKAAYLPSVAGSVTLQHERNLFPGDPQADNAATGHSVYLSATWRLFDFGGRAATRDSAQRLLSAALASHNAKLQEVLDGVISAYFEATKQSAELQATQQSRLLAASTLEATQRRESNGVAAHNDTLQAQVALAKAVLAEKRALGTYTKAITVLAYSMGISPGAVLSLPELESPVAATTGELSQWLQLAETQHPALIAAREQWEAMTRKITVARSEGRPTLDFAANLFQNGYPNQGIQTTSTRQTTVGLTITVPLFEGFARTYKVQEAAAQAQAAQAQYQDTDDQVLMNVVKAHADAEAALGTLEACETLLETSRAALESSARRYSNGAANILELLTAQTNLADAQQQRVQCLSDWYAGRLHLMTSAGVLGLTRLAHPVTAPADLQN